jgi:hypothetical protein
MSEQIEIERSFAVSGTARLNLRNVDGVIDIAAGPDEVLTVHAVKHPGPGANQTEIEITQEADGRVSVITHYMEDVIARLFHPRLHGPARVDYSVRLPKHCEVDLAFVSGSARLQGLAGEFALRSVSGPIDLEDLAGQLRVNTVSGPVTGAHLRLAGCLSYDTVSADLILADSFVPAVAGNGVSGQVRLQTELGEGPYHFRSVSGDVWLAVPDLRGCQVDMQSLSGRVRSSEPATQRHSSGGWLRAGFGNQRGPEIRLHSVSGDLHLVTPEGATEEDNQAETEAPAPTSPERLAVLDRLARGELSVDEAVSTLKR